MLANLDDFNPNEHAIAEEDLEEVDRYMLYRLQELITSVKQSYDSYNFADVSQSIHNYIAVALSAFYLDFAKDVLYIESVDDKRSVSIQTVYYVTLVAMDQL